MGQLADRLAQEAVDQTAEQLRAMQKQARELGGKITSLAAGYKAVRAVASDDADRAALDTRLAAAIAALKSDMDRLDAETRAIVDSVIDGVFGAGA